jgi:hypothetical protein
MSTLCSTLARSSDFNFIIVGVTYKVFAWEFEDKEFFFISFYFE